jgi:protein-glucosylgalactosylhydroxylysine glucosidase
MLDYRTRSIFTATQNARLHGYRGLMFPWEASPGTACEAAPAAGSGADYEHHVSLGVAHAFAQYGYATRDADYLRREAWPIVRGVAEWLQSRVQKSARGYEIRRTMGVAEQQQPIDNSAYVNMAATIVLREAVDLARRIGHEPPGAWSRIADGIVIPHGPEPDVIASHDDYDPSEEKGATPDPLAGLFPWGYEVAPHLEEATLRFYLDRADDYIGSPMLSALYGAWACRLGDRQLAAHLFDEGYAKFVSQRFNNTHEYRHDRFPEQTAAGPFIANLAGFLQACLYGIAGLRITAHGLEAATSRHLVLPAGWDAIEVEQIHLGDHTATLTARHGDPSARLVASDGKPGRLLALAGGSGAP